MMKIKNVGYHIIADFDLKNKNLEELIDEAAKFSELTDLARLKLPNFYAIVIAESHLIAYVNEGISIDIYTCGSNDLPTKKAYEHIEKRIGKPSFKFYTPRPVKKEATQGNHILCDLVVWSKEGIGRVSDLTKYIPSKKHASTYFQFPGGGASGVVVYEDAYITFHTWPETGLITMDFNGKNAPHFYQQFLEKIDSDLGILELKASYVPRHLPFKTSFKI